MKRLMQLSMKRFIQSSQTTIRLFIAAIFICGIVQAVTAPVKNEPSKQCMKFYDGEGNEIPDYAVNCMVRAQFVIVKRWEVDTIQKYFYFATRHICPFIHCPMHDQLFFHGCGDCVVGSDCYALDAIHWENPSWSYDECWDYYTEHEKSPIQRWKKTKQR